MSSQLLGRRSWSSMKVGLSGDLRLGGSRTVQWLDGLDSVELRGMRVRARGGKCTGAEAGGKRDVRLQG
jgi:hypothetical protein